MLAITVGGIMTVGTVARLGFIADLISQPTVIGYIRRCP
jgi:MFS superfamily sulfate permease-like transporter